MTIAHFKAPWMNEEHAMLYETAQAFFKSWQPREQRWLDNGMVDKEAWLEAVEDICHRRGYAKWFYADREAWLEDYRDGMSPNEAVDYQVECLL